MKERKTLIESKSPLCPVTAFAEQTENAVYFYLHYPMRRQAQNMYAPGTNLKACWVCNCREAPAAPDAGDQLSMMPQGCFSHAPGGMTISPEGLHITWLSDGNSAVLHQNGNVLAVIPPNAGLYEFPGFSRYAVGQNRYAWEMQKGMPVYWMEQVVMCDQLWAESHTQGFWQGMQQKHLEILGNFFSKNTGYYAIDDGKYPLRAVIEGERGGVTYGFTAFLSIFPQPEIGVYIRGAEQHRRIEFGFAARSGIRAINTEAYNCFMALAKHIYSHTEFFAHGHTNPWQGIPGFSAFLFVNPRAIRGMESPAYPAFAGDPVNLLWAVPLKEQEYRFATEQGSDALLHRARDLTSLHIFDGQPKFAL